MVVDTHAHLDFPEFTNDLVEVISRAGQAGVGRIITIGTSLASSRTAIGLADRFDGVFAAVGIHPNSVVTERENFLPELEELARHPKVVAIGETGLDYHYLASKKNPVEISQTPFGADSALTVHNEIRDQAEKSRQATAFEQHLELAIATGKSVIIHQRDSWADTMAILRRYSGKVKTVVHCFTGHPAQAEEVLAADCYISFTGIVTFKNAAEVRHSARYIPLERLMVETDAPYLAPVPNRGKRCEPAFVRDTAAAIAKLRGLTLDEFSEKTTENVGEFFSLD